MQNLSNELVLKSSGLSECELGQIIAVLQQAPNIKQAIIFGSRAKGNYKQGSDIDIAIIGEKLTHQEIIHIYEQLEQHTSVPYFFDVIDYHQIQDQALKSHIDRVGIKIYERAEGIELRE